MKVLLTGSNGNLGKVISSTLRKYQIEVVEASSKPLNMQRYFDLDFCPPQELLSGIDLVIHCARGSNSKHLQNDSAFLKLCKANNCPVIYIGSISANLFKSNQYGRYKKTIEDIVINYQGTVITCGLIYGENFYGQISKLKKFLSRLPVILQLSGTNEQYLTPVQGLLSELIFQIRDQQRASRIFIAHQTPVQFNDLLYKLGRNKLFTLTISKKMALLIIKITKFKINYFNSDSILGIYSDYQRDFKLQYIDKSQQIDEVYSWEYL
jgi:hypothetical protein